MADDSLIIEFISQIDNINNPDVSLRQNAEQFLDNFLAEDIISFLSLCSYVINLPESTVNIIYCSLIAINQCVNPIFTHQAKSLREAWLKDEENTMAMRNSLKTSLLNCLDSTEVFIRNKAAQLIAIILFIELEEWNDIFSYMVLNFISGSISQQVKNGIRRTFIEIFRLNMFNPETPADVIPKEFVDLFEFIVEDIKILESQQEMLDCVECIEELLRCIPQMFCDKDYVLKVIGAIEATIPKGDIELNRKFHFLMITLIDTYYEIRDQFIDRIIGITYAGMQHKFSHVSISFWHFVAEYEKEKQKNFEVTQKAAVCLIDPILELMNIEINEDDDLESFSFLILFCAYQVLGNFYNYSPKEISVKLKFFIDERLFLEDISSQISVLFAICSLCIGGSAFHQTIEAITYYLPRILCIGNSESNKIKYVTTFTLIRIVKVFPEICQDKEIIQPIFHLLEKGICSEDEGVIRKSFELISLMLKRFRILFIDELYFGFINFFNISLENEFIKENDFIYLPYNMLFYLIKQVSIDNHYDDLMQLLNSLHIQLAEVLDDFSETTGNYYIIHQQNVISSMRFLVEKLGKYVIPKLKEIRNQIFLIFNRSKYELYDDALKFLSDSLIIDDPVNVMEYAPTLNELLQKAIQTQNNQTIGFAMLLYGDIFNKVGSQVFYMLEEPLKFMFTLLFDQDAERLSTPYAQVVEAVSQVVGGLKKDFPPDYAQNYVTLLVDLSMVPTEYIQSGQCEKEDVISLLDAIFFGFTNMTIYYRDDPYLRKFERPVINLIKKVYKAKIFEDRLINVICIYLSWIIPIDGRHLNTQLNHKDILHLLDEGIQVEDKKIRSYAEIIKKKIKTL